MPPSYIVCIHAYKCICKQDNQVQVDKYEAYDFNLLGALYKKIWSNAEGSGVAT